MANRAADPVTFPTLKELGVTHKVQADYVWEPWKAFGPKIAEMYEVIQFLAAKQVSAAVAIIDAEDRLNKLSIELRRVCEGFVADLALAPREMASREEALWWLDLTIKRSGEFRDALLKYCED